MASERDLRDVDGEAFVVGLQAGLGELHPSAGGKQAEAVFTAGDDVAQELFPLRLEAVVQLCVRRDFLPLAADGFRGGRVGVVGHPVVGASAPEGYHVVAVPNEGLAAELAGELAATHSGDFVIIGGPEGLLTSDDRVRGFQRGLAKAGLPPAEVFRTGFDRTGGYDAGLELAGRIRAGQGANSGVSRLCIFAVNDVMAIGAAAALRAAGLRIPRDAAIAGFDDIETLRDFRPALSTVRLPLEEIGRLAVPGTAAGGSTPDGGTTVPVTGQVTLRRSTEPVPDPAS